MAIVNNIKKQLDIPVFELTRFAPAVSSALSSTCCAYNTNYNPNNGRYIYNLIAATSFWRIDTWTDTWMQLNSPPVTPLNFTRMSFKGILGPEGNALAGGASTITLPAFNSKQLKGYDIQIVSGTGAGQRRIVADVADAVIVDTGVVTAVNNVQGSMTLTDTTKAWAINQYAGYMVRIAFGTGLGQYRRILYNSATVLTLGDSARMPDNIWANPGIFAPAINATAGTQAVYSIESSVVTVDVPWLTAPDTTSQWRIQSGNVFLLSGAAATPFYTMQVYDVLTDTWYVRTSTTNLVSAAATDGSIEANTESVTVWTRGGVSSGTATTLVDLTQNWTVNQWANYWVRLTNGTGEGQLRQIASNTANTLTWVSAGTLPDVTTDYRIEGFDAGTATSGTTAVLTDSTKAWAVNRWQNYAVRITHGTGKGQVGPIASNTATALTLIKPFAVAPDSTSTYAIVGDGDKFYMMFGASATVTMHNIADDLSTNSRWADSGIACNASISSPAVNFGRPLGIASLTHATTTATVTTTLNHSFKVGQSITVRGATDANYNTTATVVSVPAATTLTYTMAGTPAADTLVGAQSTTVLYDATKSWTGGALVGQWVYMTTVAVTGTTGAVTGQMLQITANTANSITFVAATAPVTGISRYIICLKGALGSGIAGALNGMALGAGQLTTALQDTNQAWVVNIHAGKRVKIIGGTAGPGTEAVITSNTANTLTFGAITLPIASNTLYSILDQPVRGVGIDLNWTFGTSTPDQRGKYLICARGGAAVGFDRFDITTDRSMALPTAPQSETLGSGSMYAYDGTDRIYFTKDVTQRIYSLDVTSNIIHGAGMFPYAAPTAIIGNRMEIFSTADGLKILWLNRHSNTECFRTLLFW